MFADYLGSTSIVTQSYAAANIEKMLIKNSMTNNSQKVINEKNIDPNLITKLLQNLCELLTQNKDLYAVRALLRVIQLAKNSLVPYASTLG